MVRILSTQLVSPQKDQIGFRHFGVFHSHQEGFYDTLQTEHLRSYLGKFCKCEAKALIVLRLGPGAVAVRAVPAVRAVCMIVSKYIIVLFLTFLRRENMKKVERNMFDWWLRRVVSFVLMRS